MSSENPPEIATPKRRRGRPRKIRPLVDVITPAILRQIMLEKAASEAPRVIETALALLKATKTIVVQSQGKTEVLTVPDYAVRLQACRLLGEWLGFDRDAKADEPKQPPIIEVRTTPRAYAPPTAPAPGVHTANREPAKRQEIVVAP